MLGLFYAKYAECAVGGSQCGDNKTCVYTGEGYRCQCISEEGDCLGKAVKTVCKLCCAVLLLMIST